MAAKIWCTRIDCRGGGTSIRSGRIIAVVAPNLLQKETFHMCNGSKEQRWHQMLWYVRRSLRVFDAFFQNTTISFLLFSITRARMVFSKPCQHSVIVHYVKREPKLQTQNQPNIFFFLEWICSAHMKWKFKVLSGFTSFNAHFEDASEWVCAWSERSTCCNTTIKSSKH